MVSGILFYNICNIGNNDGEYNIIWRNMLSSEQTLIHFAVL